MTLDKFNSIWKSKLAFVVQRKGPAPATAHNWLAAKPGDFWARSGPEPDMGAGGVPGVITAGAEPETFGHSGDDDGQVGRTRPSSPPRRVRRSALCPPTQA